MAACIIKWNESCVTARDIFKSIRVSHSVSYRYIALDKAIVYGPQPDVEQTISGWNSTEPAEYTILEWLEDEDAEP